MTRWLTLVLGAIAVIGAIFGLRQMTAPADRSAGTRTVQAESVPMLDKPVADSKSAKNGVKAYVVRSVGEIRPTYLVLSGRTDSARTVTVRAGTTGTVTAAPARPGQVVDKGDLLCGLDQESRLARVREAAATVTQRELEYSAAQDLATKGWNSPARAAAARARLDAAQATLEVARTELEKTQLRAPFRGVFEKRLSDVGEFLGPGGACGVMVQLDPLLVAAEASETAAAQIRRDAAARVRLPEGQELEGRVRFIARTPDEATRAYRIEVEAANPESTIPTGRSAELLIETGKADAHLVRQALLTTDAEGRLGVRYLDADSVVTFARADQIHESADGVWIAGLPHEVLIVSEGQDFAVPGLRVTPAFAPADDAS